MHPLNKITLALALLAPLGASAGGADAGHWISTYSKIQDDACKVVVSSEEHYLATCKGVAGYKLEIDNSASGLRLTVIDPKGNPHQLAGYKAGFVADMAEWHGPVRRGKLDPEALILQLGSPGATDPAKLESSLLVIRLDETGICAINVVEKAVGSSERARIKAREARGKPCLSAASTSAAL